MKSVFRMILKMNEYFFLSNFSLKVNISGKIVLNKKKKSVNFEYTLIGNPL